VPPVTAVFRKDHRELERCLDELMEAIQRGGALGGVLRKAAGKAAAHYDREAALLARLARYDPALAAKMTAHHAEALEIAARASECDEAGGDLPYLARRFHAIAQHNIIEEERDVFPAAERCLTTPEE